MSRREKELYYQARAIGQAGDVLHSMENEEASPYSCSAFAGGAHKAHTAAAGRRASPAAPAVEAVLCEREHCASDSFGNVAPSRGTLE